MEISKRKFLLVTMVAMVALVGLAFPAVVSGDTACRFFGPVLFNGENVPDGTVITAWLESPYRGPWTTGTYIWSGNGLSVYGIDIPPAFLGGANEGETVHFTVTLPGGDPMPATSGTWTQHGGAFVWHPLYLTVGVVAILEGHVDLQGRSSTPPPHDSWITPLTVSFLQGGVVVRAETVTTDNWGDFTIPDVDPGTYNIGVKSPRALSKLETSVIMTSGTTTSVDFGTLLEGDCDDDDDVDISDFGLLADAFSSSPGDANWDDRCDFNRNEQVDITDFGLLADNFGLSGEMV